jgi:hypothetical protein
VRNVIKFSLLVILSSALVGGPAVASAANPASAPLGVVIEANRAQSGTSMATSGATVYDGDRLETGADETLRARLGGPQILLRQSTNAVVHNLTNGFLADLGMGSVVVSTVEGQTFQLVADGVTIRPATGKTTVAQITRVNANEVLLTSTRGALQLTMGDEVKTMDEGTSFRMEVGGEDPGPQPQPNPQSGGPYHTAQNRFILYAVIGVSVATGVILWRALESPSGL